MLTNLAFVFICVRARSVLVRTSAFLQQVVRGQVYIFEISPPLMTFASKLHADFACKVLKTQKYMFSKCLLRCKSFCVVPCVSFCTDHFVMVPFNMTYLHCLQILCLNISSIYIS